ncbi:MAG: glycosyltransferase [Azoarcus sp.]|jgi:glycosyltransferase involved in cell wall biosynthesis|nr:glycosyltransferase [Azoarcus sp.]
MPKVTIVLTSLNHGRWLREAIESALRQTFDDFEMFIWDDASEDDSWAIIESYEKADARIKAFRNPERRRGIYAYNNAIKIAQGEYIAIHSSDDVWEADKLQKQVDFLDRNPEYGAVFAWPLIIDDDSRPIAVGNDLERSFAQPNRPRQQWLRRFLQAGNALCHPSVLIRKQCYADCGPYNPAFCQLGDFDMWVRLCLRHEIYVLPELLVRFRWHGDGSNTSAPNPATNNRHDFESLLALENFDRLDDLDEVLAIIPEGTKYLGEGDSDPTYVLGRALADICPFGFRRFYAQKLLFKLLADPERAARIKALHGFGPTELREIIGAGVVFAHPASTAAEAAGAPKQPATTPGENATMNSPQNFGYYSDDPLSDGIAAFNAGDYAHTIEYLAQAMQRAPEDPLPPAYLAFTAVQQDLLAEAQDFFARCMQLAPQRADLKAAFGESLLKAGHARLAADYLLEAVDAQPDLLVAYPALARSLYLSERAPEAISLLQGAAGIPSAAQETIQSVLLEILAESGDLTEFTHYCQKYSKGLSDDLLAVKCLMRFEQTGETLLQTLANVQARIEREGELARLARESVEATRLAKPRADNEKKIVFMVREHANLERLQQLHTVMLGLPPERFITSLILGGRAWLNHDALQACGLIADEVLVIADENSEQTARNIGAMAPDILIDMNAYDPTDWLEAFLAAAAPRKLLWGETPLPPIAQGVATLAGERLGLAEMFPTVTLPQMGEYLALPELAFTNDEARAADEAAFAFACLTPANRIGRDGWRLFANVLRACPGSVLTLNLKDLGAAARSFIAARFEAAQIDPARLRFVQAHTMEELCRLWVAIDAGLAAPVDGGGLALPTCLWMGKPYVALASTLPWSRRPAALLETAGAANRVAADEAAYVEQARTLAANGKVAPDPALRENLRAAGLNDEAAFVRGFTAAIDGVLQSELAAA